MEKIGYTSNQPIKKEGKEFFESNVVKGLRKIKEERNQHTEFIWFGNIPTSMGLSG